ncbi:MAG: bifunctional diaminohydroxyphosphoribosylaminopyrimidine deaminase/5-amino-6-(5-phosphoribosylamino)uracil reductase RibD [Candidatus Peribacteraceae bacterium]|nr:bifunctional diaminohydroxyphosphoribosylaminopyrimidine deaminase/5-amino-6-(5-phosphoribosylamino)uracil reductase RibD [Candidatus Peribacteraceae bacterium]
MNHAHFINYCLLLASQGRGKVRANPMVGSVLVRGDKIVAEAFHLSFGQAHAERALLERFEGAIESDDVLYVNLEPCCHRGKTPPCTDIIIEKGIKRLVFGMLDPNAQVSGKGIAILREAGVEVVGPVLPEVCERFNRGFVSVQKSGRPWITLKKAQTRSGQISNKNGSPLKITDQIQDEWSHTRLRARHDAILVGVQTIISDDPKLTVRYGDISFQPARIVLDPNGRMPKEANAVGGRMIVVTKETKGTKETKESKENGIERIQIPFKNGSFDLDKLWKALDITSILVEGGERTWKSFKDVGMIDEEVILIG